MLLSRPLKEIKLTKKKKKSEGYNIEKWISKLEGYHFNCTDQRHKGNQVNLVNLVSKRISKMINIHANIYIYNFDNLGISNQKNSVLMQLKKENGEK